MKPKKRVGRRLLLAFCFVCLAFSLLFGIGVLYVRAHYETELPENFCNLLEINESPHFYVYGFSDRENRVGEAVDVTERVYATEESRSATSEELPERLLNAFVAVEDKRFWQHNGVDWLRTAKAGLNAVFHFAKRFGASTITQQTVKNVTGNDEVTVERKLQEMLYALDLEKKYEKKEILTLYLNAVSFSDNCRGIVAAASHYFGKTPAELTAAECASLAATVQSPTNNNPAKHPTENRRRRDLVLSLMLEEGYLSAEEYADAVQTDVVTVVSDEPFVRSWYTETVVEDVVAGLCEKYGMTRKEANLTLLQGGLRIYTAMDPELQAAIEAYYASEVSLPTNQKGESCESALVLMDAKTGDLLAVIGGAGKKSGNLITNFATVAKRSPGSSIKPLAVYAPALERGIITYGSVFDDVPVTFGASNDAPWPRNANRIYRGLTDVAYAVAHSTNTVAVEVLEKLGTETAFSYAYRKFHLSSLTDADKNAVGLGLGQLENGVSLRELTAAYGVFPSDGVYNPCRSFYRVTDKNGKVLLSNGDRSERVLTESTAGIMTKLLQGVVKNGTSSAVTLDKICECAGKTGTTSDDRDRWFVGFTEDYVCGVWCGYPYPEPLSGKNLCTGIWNGAMEKVLALQGGTTAFSTPSCLTRALYCLDSGGVPTDACAKDPRGCRTAVGWFVKGREPTEPCRCHRLVACDTDGGVLHEEVPSEYQTEVALLDVERHFPMQVTVTDAQYVWRGNPMGSEANADSGQGYFEGGLTDFCGTSGVEKPFNRSGDPRIPEEDPVKEPARWWFSFWQLLFRNRE